MSNMTTKELSDQDRDFFTNIQNGDVKAICVSIDKNEEIAPFGNENNESAAVVALKSKQLEVYEALIARGWCLNSNENFNEIVNELEKNLKKEIREILREFVKNPDEDHLKTLIDTFLDRNRYILFTNIEEGKLLLADNIKSRSRKKIENIIEQFHDALKIELREIHKRNFIKNPNEEHLTALITRTSIYFGGSSATTNRPKYLEIIAGAYEQLNEVKEIKAIFEVVANIKNLNIIFDFDHDSVQHADATGNENVYGKSYADKGIVYLGAKALNEENRGDQSHSFHRIDGTCKKQKISDPNSDDDDDDKIKRSKVLGVLAHELCHVAIFRIYNNNYKPYHKDDSENEQEFENVLEHCWDKRFLEEIVALALRGSKDLMYDELCVRVPHLLALYQADNDKIKFLRETFKKLFDYFETKTLTDFEKEIDLMSAVWKLKSKEPQHLTDSKIFIKPTSFELDLDSNKVFEISSNCPEMSMNWIFQKTTSVAKVNFLFLDLSHIKEEQTFELLVDAHSSCIKPIIVIDCDNQDKQEIVKIADEMKKNEINERIIFVHDQDQLLFNDATLQTAKHSWLDLKEQSKENLITRTITFQGEKLVLKEVIDLHCDALNFVPLKELLDNNLKIGKDLELLKVDIHVKRKFRNKKSEEIGSSQLLITAENSKLILLSDDPGMGKTTELKMLTMKLKKKFEKSWIAFVDLKEHSEFYEKDKNFKTEFKSSKEIANFLAKKIFKLNEFEKKVFEHLFSGNRVVLLLDGFDEISPSFKKFVTMLIKSIKTLSRNILITSTRPHLKEELCKELEVEAFTFMPLTEENCLEILEKNFKKKEITGEDLEKKIDRMIEFFEKLKMNSNPAKNPLILGMVAKVFSDDQFVQDMQANTFSIYENFVKIMINESMLKGVDAREEATSCVMSKIDIILFYQKEAFKVLFERNEKKFREFLSLCFSEVLSPPNEQITRIALMKSEGSGKFQLFQFIHQTFAEFFVADFIFKNVFDLKILNERKKKDPKIQERIESIYKILREVFTHLFRYEVVQSFIDGAFENLIVNFEQIEKEVLMSTFDQIFTKDEMPEYFRSFVEKSFLNLITVLSRCANQQDLKRLWTYKSSNDIVKNIFVKAARFGLLYFNKKLAELAHEVFNKKDFLNFFTERTEYDEDFAYENASSGVFDLNENGDTVVSIAYLNENPEVFDFYLQNELFHLAIDQFPEDYRIKLNLMRFIRDKDISGFLGEMEKIKEVAQGLENLQKVLNSWTNDERTIYYELCRYLLTPEDYEKLWELLRGILGENDFKALIKKPDIDEMTPLMFKANYRQKEVLISFWELLSENLTDEEKDFIFMEESRDGWNAFDYATWNEDPETFLAIKDLYLKTFGEDKMKSMLMRERWNGERILMISISNDNDEECCNVATVKALWTFIQEIFDISIQKSIFMKADVRGDTFYEAVLKRKDCNELMKIFEQFIEEHLTALEKNQFKHGIVRGWLRNYFTEKNEKGENIVSLIFKSTQNDSSPYDQQLSDEELYSIIDSSIFKFLFKADITALRNELKKTKEVALGLKYFQHFLNSWTNYGKSIYYELCRSISTTDIKDYKKLWKLLRRILGENDFKTLIKKPDSRGATPLMFKAELRVKEVFIFFWELLSEDLTDEEKYFIFMEESEDGFNAFDHAISNKDPETFLAIKDLYMETFGEEKMKNMLMRERENGESILLTSVRYRPKVETLKAFWIFIQKIFDISNQKRIFMKADVNGNTFYDKLLKREDFDEVTKIFEKFIDEHLTALEKEPLKYGRDKLWLRKYFTEKNEKRESFVSFIFKSHRSDVLYLQSGDSFSSFDELSDNELYSELELQIFKFLKEKDLSSLQNDLEKAKELGLKLFQHFLISETTDEETIYLNACRSLTSIEDFEKLWNLLQRILDENDFVILITKRSSKNKKTPLMLKAQYHQKEVFNSFWKLLTEGLTDEKKEKLLIDEDGDGDNAFDCATLNIDPETFLAIKDLYMKTIGEEKMRDMLTRDKKKGESILLVSLRIDQDNVETVKALWTFIQEVFDEFTQKTFLLKTDKNGKTLFEIIVNRKDFNEKMKIFEPFIEEHLTELEKEQFKYIG